MRAGVALKTALTHFSVRDDGCDGGRAVVSAERSAYRAAAFATRINKTRRTMLEDLCKEFLPS